MGTPELPKGCACCRLSRRLFLKAGGATCAGALGILAPAHLLRAAEDGGKVRVRIIYSLHAEKQPGPDWPNKGFDFIPVMARIGGELAKRCPGFELVSSMAKGPEEAKKILEEDKSAAIDGYLVYQMNCWNRVVQTIAASDKPVLYADFQCLGGFYGGHIHAYPCLGFHELNNEGLVGGCECDVRSTSTMVTMSALTQGRTGFISDPVIDTANRQIIYAHCVAPNRMFGPQGETNPFHILTHSEDRQGASVRSVLPVGYMTTTLEMRPDRKEILFHQGKAVANDPDDRACRTKLCAEPVGDIEKLFAEWDQWGWHRVTVYGDLKPQVRALADAMGYKIVPEA